MEKQSRRDFLRYTSLGVGAVGVVAVSPALLTGAGVLGAAPNRADGIQPVADAAPADPGAPVVAYVHDLSKGEIHVMVGTRQVIHHDKTLAAHLARVAQTAE